MKKLLAAVLLTACAPAYALPVPASYCDGTDRTADINAVIAATNEVGDALQFPPGVCVVSTLAQVTSGGGISGAGMYSTIIKTNAVTGVVMELGGHGGVVRDLGIDSSVVRLAGGVGLLTSGKSVGAERVLTLRQYIGFKNAGFINYLKDVRSFRGTPASVAAGSSGIVNSKGAYDHSILNVTGAWVAASDTSDASSLDHATYIENCYSHEFDMITIVGSSGFLCNSGLAVMPQVPTVIGVVVDSSNFDSVWHFGIVVAPGAGVHASDIRISNSWIAPGFGGGVGWGIYIGGAVSEISVSNTRLKTYSGGQGVGIFMGVVGPIRAHFSNNMIAGYSTGFFAGNDISNWSLTGGEISSNGTGILVGTGNSNYSITSVQNCGNTTPISNSSPSGVNAIRSGNACAP